MKLNIKLLPHLVAVALISVIGFFIYSFKTEESYSGRTITGLYYNTPAVYGYRTYGIAVLVIAAFYLCLAFAIVYNATKELPE